jgi:hypothetical protein
MSHLVAVTGNTHFYCSNTTSSTVPDSIRNVCIQVGFDVNQIVEGRIVEVNSDFVVVDVGFKSEGAIDRNEWGEGQDPPQVGQTVKVLIEEVEDEAGPTSSDMHGMISLSKRKAEKIIEWEKMMSSVSEGQVVTGTVTRKIKGGLLVDIGVNVFLPASQVDIRRPATLPTLSDAYGSVRSVEDRRIAPQHCGQPPIVDREATRRRSRSLDERIGNWSDPQGCGQEHRRLRCVRRLGWHRWFVAHHRYELGTYWPPIRNGGNRSGNRSQDSADRPRKAKDCFGSQAEDRNPWENIETKYPVGSQVKGEVVNVMSYGAFVKLEPGIEGLVHISEMSWTQAHQSSKRVGANRRPDRCQDFGHRFTRPTAVLGYEADSNQSLGCSLAIVIQKEALVPARFATSPTTVRSSNWKKVSTACCTYPTCLGPARSAIQAKSWKRAKKYVAASCLSTRTAAVSPWVSSSWTTIHGQRHSRQVPA